MTIRGVPSSLGAMGIPIKDVFRLDAGVPTARKRSKKEYDSVVLQPLQVEVVDGRLDKAMRKLKRKMASEGVLKELKRRRRALKPSEAKRRKRADAARKRRKRERAVERRG